jgi:hypothetical protein
MLAAAAWASGKGVRLRTVICEGHNSGCRLKERIILLELVISLLLVLEDACKAMLGTFASVVREQWIEG